MPWLLSEDNSLRYELSAYVKEELPTWEEIWYDFYMGKCFNYDPNIDAHKTNDMYWKLPRRLYLMAIVCNEINKRLHEDGRLRSVITSVMKDYDAIINNIYCSLIEDPDTFKALEHPIIYHITHPKGHKNPFVFSTKNRIDVRDNLCSKKLTFGFIVDTATGTDVITVDTDITRFYILIDQMLLDIKSYFSGDEVGWKDDSGNVIEKPQINLIASNDPAL